MGTSWKTLLAGIAAILISIAGVISHIVEGSPIDFPVHISEIVAGFGLIFAKDFNVTGGSKEVPK